MAAPPTLRRHKAIVGVLIAVFRLSLSHRCALESRSNAGKVEVTFNPSKVAAYSAGQPCQAIPSLVLRAYSNPSKHPR